MLKMKKTTDAKSITPVVLKKFSFKLNGLVAPFHLQT